MKNGHYGHGNLDHQKDCYNHNQHQCSSVAIDWTAESWWYDRPSHTDTSSRHYQRQMIRVQCIVNKSWRSQQGGSATTCSRTGKRGILQATNCWFLSHTVSLCSVIRWADIATLANNQWTNGIGDSRVKCCGRCGVGCVGVCGGNHPLAKLQLLTPSHISVTASFRSHIVGQCSRSFLIFSVSFNAGVLCPMIRLTNRDSLPIGFAFEYFGSCPTGSGSKFLARFFILVCHPILCYTKFSIQTRYSPLLRQRSRRRFTFQAAIFLLAIVHSNVSKIRHQYEQRIEYIG